MAKDPIKTSRGEVLFSRIVDRAAIDALIGEPEDGNLDCKEWPRKEKDGHEMLAKAVCGLTNSDGGVLIIGMQARQLSPGDPDVITAVAPVADTSDVRSRILTLVGMLVEPPIVGIETREISETTGSKSGFVILHVPRSDGPPHRSRKDSRFYIRVGSVTLPMEYWQIEDRFGSRPHPKLDLIFVRRSIEPDMDGPEPLRKFALGLRNTGNGIAKFPSIRMKRGSELPLNCVGIDGINFGLPSRPSEADWLIFGGGVNDVIYPGQELMIAKLLQRGIDKDIEGTPTTITPGRDLRDIMRRLVYPRFTFSAEVACEGMPTTLLESSIDEEDFIHTRR